jgi:hypothetical protein
LIAGADHVQFDALEGSLLRDFFGRSPVVNNAVHRFDELIAGRSYQIEVAAVAKDRWRACIVRLPGIPTALMPFYGSTPHEAANLLRQWLTRAHERAAGGSRRKA